MASLNRDLFAIRTLAVFSLISASLAASLDCKDVLRPMDKLNPRDWEGMWAMVADSIRVIQSPEPERLSNSTVLYFYNSTFTKANLDLTCSYFSNNVTFEGPDYKFDVNGVVKFSGTIFYSSCPDCLVLSFIVDSPHYKSQELCLFSKRRSVEETELQEFMAQVKCMDMPEASVMNPNEELCPYTQAQDN
ncbi:hypothetical protein D5F01_LYC00152 [Xyrichtys novacula]|uniref:Apolipoprotein M n=1 Tax=Xyrichtys novacula TaxID=13765 RepID=A0AAV1EXZ9_XYRNO|nr:hypothetical protein D5F01_LYC00152 [Xyrichtys novacula]